jgi:putative Holliday junction resolvase
MMSADSSILAFDVGSRRIGVASANVVARIAHPLTTMEHTADILPTLQQLVEQEHAVGVVVGLPRNLSGDDTDQTRTVRTFANDLKEALSVPLYWQDEAVTSRKAEEELLRRGKPFAKGDIDALAATYILEDFLQEHPEVRG